MFKVLLSLPLLAVAVPALSPDILLDASHGVADALFVLTPPLFVAGAGFQMLRRSAS